MEATENIETQEPLSTLVQPKSTHECPVFWFDFAAVSKVEDSDNLGRFTIPGTDYNYILNLNDWRDYKGFCGWLVPDSLADTTREEFSFLKDGKYFADSTKGGLFSKVRARKIRGNVSYGLMVKLTGDWKEGDNAASFLNVHRFEPVVEAQTVTQYGLKLPSGEATKSPKGTYYHYHVDAFLKYGRIALKEGESCLVLEKLHGESYRTTFRDGQMHVSSREVWKKEFTSPPNISLEYLIEYTKNEEKAKQIYEKKVINFKPGRSKWWVALDNTPNLREFCEANEGYCVYGELVGGVGGYSYNCNGKIRIFVFDILQPDGTWMNAADLLDMCQKWNLEMPPLIYRDWAFNFDEAVKLADGNTALGGKHLKEGCCIRPMIERWDEKVGRVHFKIINPDY